jgi:hypothetical protein
MSEKGWKMMSEKGCQYDGVKIMIENDARPMMSEK